MDALPIFMRLQGRRCVVVGGGEVAVRKINMLLRADAAVDVVAPVLHESLLALLADKKISHPALAFDPDQLTSACLVIAATGDEVVNIQVSAAAKLRGIPVNVVDAPDLCSFTMPAIVDRSPVVIAIGTGGGAPVLARLLRARLETLIPASYGRLALLAAKFRQRVKKHFATVQERRIFWEQALSGPVAEMVFSGHEDTAQQMLTDLLKEKPAAAAHGEVYLVGGGPGDPDLLTFRALRLMQQADVCLYDKLVSQEVLNLVRRDAELIYVGKARRQHTMRQGEINKLLVKLAQQGKRVLRLKGGDPFIFGRGGEEIETLMEHGIPFQVVPGITAANGVSTYAGIPLTHRDHAQSCLFATGHLKAAPDGGEPAVDLDWPALARPHQTLVIYMGLLGLPEICRQLVAHGLPATTPAALIQQGTTPRQRVVVADLATLPQAVVEAEMRAPCLIIVGGVVTLREKLSWFNPQPADGER